MTHISPSGNTDLSTAFVRNAVSSQMQPPSLVPHDPLQPAAVPLCLDPWDYQALHVAYLQILPVVLR